MTLNEYQAEASQFAKYPQKKIGGLTYTVLALCGEAGELANKLKKILREDREVTHKDVEILKDELSDVLWYVSSTAVELGITLDDVASFNIAKLTERRKKD
jgi:NTP pyrophosphatase (non-canonical NTP hydrolase)